VGEGGQLSREAELTVLEGLPEASDELAAKDSRQHLEGKKEPVLRFHPVSVIETQPTGGNDAVDMRVVFTLPAPLARVALQNKKLIYGLLLRTSAETLLEVARDPWTYGVGSSSRRRAAIQRSRAPV